MQARMNGNSALYSTKCRQSFKFERSHRGSSEEEEGEEENVNQNFTMTEMLEHVEARRDLNIFCGL